MYVLQNDLLQVKIKSIGAELSSVTSKKNTIEFMWQADSNIWGSHAPNLFPIIGSLKDDSYIYNNNTYPMTKHGFVRKNEDFIVKNSCETNITFQLNSNDVLYKMYPFLFEFEISYTLINNTLTINHKVKNTDTKTLYFSVGGHPAFNCPLYKDEKYTDYSLEFENSETSESYLLNMETGLVSNKTKTVFINENEIKLHGDLFNEDALIFKDLKSRKVILKHKSKGPIISVNFKDFPFLGIWAKQNAPYICIEPWLGIADSETTDKKIENKEGIVALNVNEIFNASYSIEIDKRHLV
ncbi:aldose 1-epimerase family protein [Winogradskyella sp. UBA3174]|uniref:aldose 1-epimerase family protein n=1 Tax=Winogradskyella sp. UBA3174 TaxID=1947785 RepID=UPI0025DFEA79|nr:aldose 1-epimerase family protein [Winogradskyella sp. UBA3174]|tara:strand:- start:1491 stop:2381 length:891 start_codon:yes stop_codon:yes gene_type:complete